MPDSMTVDSRSVIITGVSQGLGAALFDQFDAAGDRILALGRRFTEAQRAVAHAAPDRVRLRTADLTVPTGLPGPGELAAFADGAEHVALVHNAAVFNPFGAVGALPDTQLTHAVAVNLTAPMLLTNALFSTPLVAPTDDGAGMARRRLTVIFISSSAAHRVAGGRSVYAATKRGAEMFFASLATQFEDDKQVSVVIVDPGMMDTPMHQVVRQYAHGDGYFPDRERFLARYDRGELASPADTAGRIIDAYLR